MIFLQVKQRFSVVFFSLFSYSVSSDIYSDVEVE